MIKLIYRYNRVTEPCSATKIIPFEYRSKEEFIYDMVKRFNKKFFKENIHAEILGECLTKQDINNIEWNIFTLEEWFNKDKQITFVL